MRRSLPVLLVIAAVPLLAACGAGTGIRDEGALASPQARPVLAPPQPVGIYFARYGALVQVTRRITAGDSFAQAALVALMNGPSADEFGRGYVTALPADARVVNVTPDPYTGNVRVDLAGSFDGDAQIAADPAGFRVRRRQVQLEQIVYTLAAFPTIHAVSVYFNGVAAGLPDISGGPLDTEALTTASFQTLTGPADSSDSCVTGQRQPARPPLRLAVRPSTGFITGRFVRIDGSTTAKTGTLIVDLVQQNQQIRRTQLFNKRSVPCQTFAGALEIPFGVTGNATVRAFVQEREQAKPKAQVDVPVTIAPSG